MENKDIGQKGEDLACEYLVNNGYNILCRNFWSNIGEIDIIAKKSGLFADKAIHFIEVKSSDKLSGGFFPEQRVNYKKQQKIIRLAEIWLSKNKYPEDVPYQIDVIAVSGNKIDFFENVVEG